MKTRKVATSRPPDTREPRAFSYVRFSHPDQAKGDSLRRQTEDTERWCERNGIKLDESLTLRDLGVSAFKGKHRDDKAALGRFLEAVKQGRVPQGSYLVIENLDRLSREDERTALRLWLDILDHGVNIVQLHPETVFRHERSDMADIIRAIIELSRGHSESRMKSKRLGSAWQQKRKEARANGTLITRRLPSWVEERDGVMRLLPKRAAVVKKIFRLAAAGYGHKTIVKKLTEENVLPFGGREAEPDENGRRKAKEGERWGAGRWTRPYVAMILRDRRALGEYQPRLQDGTKDGPPIAGYYPPAVTTDEWYQARAGAAQRKLTPGPLGEHVSNLFAGLVKDLRSGSSYYCTTRLDHGRHTRILVNSDGQDGTGTLRSFPYATFERGVLGMLRELTPEDVLGREDGPADVAVLEGELAHVRDQLAILGAELLKGASATLAAAARQLEDRERELTGQLEDAQERTARPLGATWQDAVDLIGMLDNAKDKEDVRLRLRSALRRTISRIWLLVCRRGSTRIAYVNIIFAGGGPARAYTLIHQPPKRNQWGASPGRWWVGSYLHDYGEHIGVRGPAAAAAFEKGYVPMVLKVYETDMRYRAAAAAAGQVPEGVAAEPTWASLTGEIPVERPDGRTRKGKGKTE